MLLLAAAILALSPVANGNLLAAEPAPRPNIVLILADDKYERLLTNCGLAREIL